MRVSVRPAEVVTTYMDTQSRHDGCDVLRHVVMLGQAHHLAVAGGDGKTGAYD